MKPHWTTTPEGKARMAISMKKMWAAKRAAKKVVEKHVKQSKSLTVSITGPDARKALAKLLSCAQYDKLDVAITVTKG